jgi:hypothetical protein
MSRRQQVITRYIADLCPCIAVRYRFHFLRTEKDPSAQQMLQDDLRGYSATNPNIVKCISIPTSLSWTIAEDESLPRTASTSLHQARSYFSSFCIDSALKFFESDKRENPGQVPHLHYLERLQINLALGRWNRALSLAIKIPSVEGVFLSAVASGDFDRAASQLSAVCRHLAFAKSSRGSKELLASAWELAHLVVYVALTRCSSCEVGARLEEVRGVSQYDLDELIQFGQLFAARNFQKFVAKLSEVQKEFVSSYYLGGIAVALAGEIRMNVIVNCVAVYSRVSLGQVGEIVGYDAHKVANALVSLIQNGRVRGYVDRIDGKFYGTDANVEDLGMADQFERTVLVREKLELLKWKVAYEKAVTK